MLFRSDRKSTRLNSSHTIISYAVFCLKKKENTARLVEVMQLKPHENPNTMRPGPPGARYLNQRLHRHPTWVATGPFFSFFFFKDTATTEIYTFSRHPPFR